MSMASLSDKDRQRILKLHAVTLGSEHANERDNAREKLDALTKKHGLSWNDVTGIVAAEHIREQQAAAAAAQAAAWAQAPSDTPTVNVLVLTETLIERVIPTLDTHERIAAALWTLHTWVFDRFTITPRLVLRSAVPGSGKSTLLSLIQQLAKNPFRSGNPTPAVIYTTIDNENCTMIVDEADNLDWVGDGNLRAVFNEGYMYGGSVDRLRRDSQHGNMQPHKFNVFAPLAVAVKDEQGDILRVEALRTLADHRHEAADRRGG
jgi:hypothetical protein